MLPHGRTCTLPSRDGISLQLPCLLASRPWRYACPISTTLCGPLCWVGSSPTSVRSLASRRRVAATSVACVVARRALLCCVPGSVHQLFEGHQQRCADLRPTLHISDVASRRSLEVQRWPWARPFLHGTARSLCCQPRAASSCSVGASRRRTFCSGRCASQRERPSSFKCHRPQSRPPHPWCCASAPRCCGSPWRCSASASPSSAPRPPYSCASKSTLTAAGEPRAPARGLLRRAIVGLAPAPVQMLPIR
mmetsp:Transcript_54919/g.117852  ORF Transcript_54919/g.117852 Transcript_54919/m.117852 type:complete len:250 (+) Transcript_54919:316-1065(+)